jgi:hypothetical protein
MSDSWRNGGIMAGSGGGGGGAGIRSGSGQCNGDIMARSHQRNGDSARHSLFEMKSLACQGRGFM